MRSSADNRLIVRVRLTPRGGRDRIEGWIDDPSGPVLKVRVSAPPIDGRANEALTRLLAKHLGLARSSVTIRTGHTARIKTVKIAGDPVSISGGLGRAG